MSTILAPYSNNRAISHLLLRIACMDETPTSSAVLHGILAISSMKLYGSAEALVFKAKAVSMLSASLKEGMHPSELVQCLAASLLLGSLHIFNTADTYSDWTFFVCGAIKIVKAMSLPRVLTCEEGFLLDWVSCCTVLAQFSQLHWVQSDSCVYRRPCTENPQLRNIYSRIPEESRALSFLGCSIEFLEILSATRFAVLSQSDPHFLSPTHCRQLDALELSLQSIHRPGDAAASQSQAWEKRAKAIAETYRLAGLIYLHRAGRRTRPNFPPTVALVEDAFQTLDDLGDCEDPWPLFIIGCEARDDEQRMKISGILARALRKRDTRSLRSVQKMIEAWWIQDDLREEDEEEEDVIYLLRMNALVSAHRVIPMFM